MEENKLNVLHKIISSLDTIEKIDKRTNRAFAFVGNYIALHKNAWEQLFNDTEAKVIDGMDIRLSSEEPNTKRNITLSDLEKIINIRKKINKLILDNDWILYALNHFFLLEPDVFKKIFEIYDIEETEEFIHLLTYLRGHRIKTVFLKGEQ